MEGKVDDQNTHIDAACMHANVEGTVRTHGVAQAGGGSTETTLVIKATLSGGDRSNIIIIIIITNRDIPLRIH